jgi:glycerate 2-kinase
VRVVIAPDSFGGTLTAREAAMAIAEGWAEARSDDDVTLLPLSDGGEGLLDVVAQPHDTWLTVEVSGPLGHPTEAALLLRPDGTAVVESAQACGLALLEDDQRRPLMTTTYGVGQLVRAAGDAGARRIVVGLGGSATVDGGAGMATALGYRLLRADGNGVKVGGRYVRDLERIEPAAALGVPVVAAVDVTNPLLGPLGAAPVFGPQKGASPDDVPILEEALARLADVAERDLPGGPWRDLPGAGAAGGPRGAGGRGGGV